MPVVFIKNGVKIKINAKDHNPPHCHVEYPGAVARYDLKNMRWLESDGFSVRALGILEEAIKNRREELLARWSEYHE